MYGHSLWSTCTFGSSCQKGPQPLPHRGHDGLDLLFLGVVCVGVPVHRFKWLSAVSAFDCFLVLVTTQQHPSVAWLRGPQKTRACHVGRGRLPDRLRVDRGGLLSRQARRPIHSGEAFEQVLPHGDAGTRTLPIREAIRRLFLSFTLAVKEGHLGLLGIGSRVQARIRVRRLTKLSLSHLQQQLI